MKMKNNSISLPLNLAYKIINLEYTSKKILEIKDDNRKLCFCRKLFCKKYIEILQYCLIRITAKIIKYNDDLDLDKTLDFKDLENWFFKNIYLTNDEEISDKIIIFFNLIQRPLEEFLFNEIKKIFFVYKEDLNRIIDLVYNILENLIFNIISININCNFLDDKIFKSTEICKIKNCRSDCSSKCNFHKIFNTDKKITIYFNRENTFCLTWFDIFLKLMLNYYNKKDVEIVLNFDFLDTINNKKIDEIKNIVERYKDLKIFGDF